MTFSPSLSEVALPPASVISQQASATCQPELSPQVGRGRLSHERELDDGLDYFQAQADRDRLAMGLA